MALDAPTNASTSRPSSTLFLLRRPLEDCEGTWGTLGAGGLDAPVFVARGERPGEAWASDRGRAGRARAGRGRSAASACGHWQGPGGGAGGQAGGQGCVRAGGLARGIYLVQPRHGSGRGTAAPWSVARQYQPRHRSPSPALATSALWRATMHGAAQAFGRARAIGAAKSVSFFKKPTVLDLKLISKKC